MKESRKKTSPNKRELDCEGCSDCCRYVAVEVDRPTNKRDYSDYFWHLMHEGVALYIGHDRTWNLEFVSRCTRLNERGQCSDYDNRPSICREYSLETCTTHSEGAYYRYKFHSPEELKAYLKSRNIDFEYKRKKT